MTDRKRYQIPCTHTSENDTVSDYHPLTRDELRELLAVALSDRSTASDVQCRIVQGIPGIVCPHEIDGEVAKRMNKVEEIFVYVHMGDREGKRDVLDELCALLEVM